MNAPAARRGPAILLAALLVIGVVVALAALADLGPFADEQLDAREFRARADEICAEAHRQFVELQRDQPATAADAAALTARLIEISEDELDDIGDLDAPAELDGALDRYLAARESAIGLLRDGLDAAERQDGVAYARAQAEVARGQRARLRLARKVGLDECSRPITSVAQLEADAEAPTSSSPGAPPTVNNPPTGTR